MQKQIKKITMIYCADVSASNKSYLGSLAHCVAHYNLITNDPQYVMFFLYCVTFTAVFKGKKEETSEAPEADMIRGV